MVNPVATNDQPSMKFDYNIPGTVGDSPLVVTSVNSPTRGIFISRDSRIQFDNPLPSPRFRVGIPGKKHRQTVMSQV